MILFGAGSSIPFEIPTMATFTKDFKEAIRDTENEKLILHIEEAINEADQYIGAKIPYDLETLLSILTDITTERIITPPTAILLIKNQTNIKQFRENHNKVAKECLKILKQFIFKKCINPVAEARKSRDYTYFNYFYGALLTLLNGSPLKNIQPHIQNIFTTNWDICFKSWVQYNAIKIYDGTKIDEGGNPVLDVSSFTNGSGGFTCVPLHGSLDLFRKIRPQVGGEYSDILKNPMVFDLFGGEEKELEDLFIIYPMEATGYNEAIQSPYFDMLYKFRTTLINEDRIFIIGSSIRDVTISSILEQVVTEKIRMGAIKNLSDNLEERKREAHTNLYKLVIFTRDANKLKENLRNRSKISLSSAFVPIEVNFPKMKDIEEKKENYDEMIKNIYNSLLTYQIITENKSLFEEIDKYGVNLRN